MRMHLPVMIQESLEYLQVKPGGLYIDATYGAGGHSREIISRGGKVLALDVNPLSVENADQDPNLKIVLGNFKNLSTIAGAVGFDAVDGIIFDLGVSSDELVEIPGLSFLREEFLDMRLDPNLAVTAADLLAALPEPKLAELFSTYGDEPDGWRIAKAIVAARKVSRIENTRDLVRIVEQVKGRARGGINPATKVFQALRIAVNMELEALTEALPQAEALLKKDGRLVVISFHSGEDRIVKNFLKESKMKVLTAKPITPTPQEIATNPRSRSAKLRAAVKIVDSK